jgi:AraC family transcriptional regulator, regulatory protein of adaptative response / methylated-DNA-[protein]-cysteine methyltransferase
MSPDLNDTPSSDYLRVAQAIEYLQAQHTWQPNLAQLSQHMGLSEHHLQRLFSRWAGVSPKRFVQYLTKEHAKQWLRQTSVFDSSLAVGLSGGGRLHDLLVTCEAVTPGEYASGGAGLHIHHGVHDSPFGPCLIASTSRGICHMAFVDPPKGDQDHIATLAKAWPHARLTNNPAETRTLADAIFSPALGNRQQPLHVLVKGSNFQIQVWQALLKIPSGHLSAYSHVAKAVGKPNAVRAVATAIANNQLAYLIPCHRVIRQSGHTNQYRWGATRKKAMLAWEAAKTEAPQEPYNSGFSKE